jgi:hypothetical protein
MILSPFGQHDADLERRTPTEVAAMSVGEVTKGAIPKREVDRTRWAGV